MTHTPGPWVHDDGDGYSAHTIWAGCSPSGHGAPGRMIADIAGDDQFTEPNARLIAAAPDLLEVAEALVSFDGRNNVNHLKDMARAAIAKAERTQ